MITISWQELIGYFLAVCAGFTCICVAVGWFIKLVKAARKPAKDVHDMLDNDNKRIKALEEQSAFILKAISLLLQDDLAILEHLRTNNSSGKMAEQEKKVQTFLTER